MLNMLWQTLLEECKQFKFSTVKLYLKVPPSQRGSGFYWMRLKHVSDGSTPSHTAASHGRLSLTQHYATFSREYKKAGAARGANENV